MSVQTAAAPPDLEALPLDATIDAEGAAALLSCSVKTIHRMLAAGEMPPCLRLGRIVRWRVRTFRAWLQSREGVSA
jgi:excisionase family DNA binding protein